MRLPMDTIADSQALRPRETREELLTDTLHARSAQMLAATVRPGGRSPAHGTPIPALWHWACFAPVAPAHELGPDGHPLRGGFLPSVPLPRRMWAAGDLSFHRAPLVGEPLLRQSRVLDVQHKSGRSGELVFVIVQHEIRVGGEPCISERQHIVYRGADAGLAAKPLEAPDNEEVREDVSPDPVMLFRYSALTFNGHRIHYDRDYATAEEGYPGLVVHGPLLATLLAGLLERHQDRPLKHFAFKAVRPAFAGEPLSLCLRRETATEFTLWSRNERGHLTMIANASV